MLLKVKVELQHTSIKHISKAMPLNHFPLFVNDFKGYVFIGRTSMESYD